MSKGLPPERFETIEHDGYELTIKAAWDAATKAKLEGQMERIHMGIESDYQSTKEALYHVAVIGWNVMDEDGAPLPVTLGGLRRLPSRLYDMVLEYYEDQWQEQLKKVPATSSSDTSTP